MNMELPHIDRFYGNWKFIFFKRSAERYWEQMDSNVETVIKIVVMGGTLIILGKILSNVSRQYDPIPNNSDKKSTFIRTVENTTLLTVLGTSVLAATYMGNAHYFANLARGSAFKAGEVLNELKVRS